MKSLLKEFARGDQQQDLKTSDGSDAGQNDVASKPVNVGFNLMRNMINTENGVTGSDVNNYLERAHDLNDEVDTVGFAIETDDGDYIKVYVNAQQADEFEQEMSKLLGLDDDSESAINTLAQKFDIVDVVWPQDPDGDGEGEEGAEDPYADVTIDDDPSAFMGDDSTDTADAETEVDNPDAASVEDDELAADALPADDDADKDDADGAPKSDGAGEEKPKHKKSLMKDIAGGEEKPKASDDEEAPADDTAAADEAPADDEALADDEAGESKSGKGPEEVDAGAEDEAEEDEGEEELDADGNPVKKEKKKAKKEGEKEVTEEGLKLGKLAALAEAARDEITAHVAAHQARGNKGKYVIDCLMTGGTMGRREYQHKVDGEVVYFDTIEEAETVAKELGERRNHVMARAHYSFTPRIVEDDNMSIGSKFLQRVTEAAAPAETSEVKLDTVWKGLHNRMKKPYEKKIVELFALLGIPGRYVGNEEGLEDSIRAGGDIIRRAGRKQSAFNAFYDALKNGGVVEARKAGSRVQKTMETVMVVLGFPETMVTTEGGGPLMTVLRRAASKIEQNTAAESALIALAKAFGLTTAQVNEAIDVGQDDFMEAVMSLVLALGIPEGILAPRRAMIIKSLREKKMSLTNRGTIQQRMLQLMQQIAKGTKQSPGSDVDNMQEALQEGLLMEAFGPLEAVVGKSLDMFNALEPAAGPAMMAGYEGTGSHEETVLIVAVDPDADDDNKSLRVGIDGPWDGSIHAKYFPNNKDGYKAAVDYANMLRTANLKTGGRPKGWKDSAPEIKRLPANDTEEM